MSRLLKGLVCIMIVVSLCFMMTTLFPGQPLLNFFAGMVFGYGGLILWMFWCSYD